MKKVTVTLFALLLIGAAALGQAPELIKFQGVAKLDGEVVNTSIEVRLSVLEGGPEGTVAYQDEVVVAPNDNGVFSVNLGENPVMNSLSSIDWPNNMYYLNAEIRESISAGWQQLGEPQLITSVPYALYGQDEDADPTNEYQQLSLSGNQLSLVPGSGSPVVLPSIWSLNGSTAEYLNGSINVLSNVDAGLDLIAGDDLIAEDDIFGDDLFIGNSDSWGFIGANGGNGNYNFQLSTLAGDDNHGWLGILNGGGQDRIRMTILGSGEGFSAYRGSNGNENILITSLSGNSNNGYLGIQDASGNIQCGGYVNSSGQGIIFGDEKNFVMEHPEDDSKQIWYCSIEGPEAAAYERGTAQIQNGEKEVIFSDHFKMVANPETMTVILTPLDANTYGLAVVHKSANGFVVKELMNGTGNFSFDWEVKCVRKGHENYEVIRDKKDMLPNYSDSSPAKAPE